MDLDRILSLAAGTHPERTAVRCGDRTLTYGGLQALVGRLARDLTRSGARRGDRIAALFPNCHFFLAAYFACAEEGFVLVPMNLRLHPVEQLGLLGHCGARLMVGTPDRLAPLTEADIVSSPDGWSIAATGGWRGAVSGAVSRDQTPCGSAPENAAESATFAPDAGTSGTQEVSLGADAGNAADAAVVVSGRAAPDREAPFEDRAALLYYTSGTTGDPKGVVLTRENLTAHARMTLDELNITAGDVWLHAAPMFHLADAWAVWSITAAGGVHVQLPRYDGAEAYDLIDREGITLTNLVPSMIPPLLAETERRGRPPGALRMLLSGGAPIAPSLVRRITDLMGCEYVQTYGLTETSPFLTFSLPDEAILALPEPEQFRYRSRTGRAVTGIELRVVRPAGADRFEDVEADDTAVGEVVVRGATVTPGYWRNPEATRTAWLGGWFHTGDLGTIDERGSLNLVDRAKDVIVTGGESVYCSEVEAALYEHPAVFEAAVFGVPDERWGEAVRAAVVLKGGEGGCPAEEPAEDLAEEILTHCRRRIAAYKCPRVIDWLPALPRTGSGKIDKKALREPHWRGHDRRIH